MSEAPERIWAGRTQRVIGGKPINSWRQWWTETAHDKGTAYIRADLVPGWQPIETAPKDEGLELLLFCTPFFGDDGGVQIGCFRRFSRTNPLKVDWHSREGHYLDPTHWQPLPERPPIKTDTSQLTQ